MTAAFFLTTEAKRELNVYNNGNLLPPCPVPKYFGVILDRLLTSRHHLETAQETLHPSCAVETTCGIWMGCRCQDIAHLCSWSTLPLNTAHQFGVVVRLLASLTVFLMMLCALPLDACVPLQRRTCLSADIQPAELRRLKATLLANRAIHDPDHVLHRQLVGKQDACLGRLRSRRSFVPAAWKLLGSLSKLDIRVKQWNKHKWDADSLESTSSVRALIPRVSSRPLGMSLPRTSWVRLHHLRTGVGRFHSSKHKWDLAPSPNCECGATEQTADHVISSCLIHHVPRGTRGLQVLDDTTRCWLNTTTASIWQHSSPGW